MDAVKVKLFGCPEQLAAAGKVGGMVVLVGVALAAAVVAFVAAFWDGTLILTVTLVPNNAFLVFRKRHAPAKAPVLAGAVMGTEMSAVAPGAVAGTGTLAAPFICAPLTNARV